MIRMRTAFAGLALASALVAGPALAEGFELTSPDISEGERIADRHVFNGFGCDGQNVSPALEWSGAPEGTQSFALTVYDPDAPTGSGWWHWVVFNLPPETTSLPAGVGEGDLPQGAVQSRTDFGTTGYGGPCPPEGHGPHRYIFTVHALEVDSLPLEADAPGAMVGFFLNANAIDTATLTATYER